MKKVLLSLLTPVLCLLLCLAPCTASLVYADENSVDWNWDREQGILNFSVEEDAEPQLVGRFYLSESGNNYMTTYLENGFQDLHLVIGVIGDEPAQNVQVKLSAEQPDDEYRSEIDFYAEISADNYETIIIHRYAFFDGGENCGFSLQDSIKLLNSRTDFSNGTKLSNDFEALIALSSVGVDSIEPGTDNLREIVIPIMGYSDPPTFTEANQPPQTRFNAITDNPVIGDEATNSAWITDEQGNIVSALTANQTYTQHYYLRVSGPDPATNTTIKAKPIDGQKIASGDSWSSDRTTVKADEVRSFSYKTEYNAQDNVQLHYVDGSLTLCRQGQDDIALNPSLFFQDGYSASGTKIGTNGLDGIVAPGADSACEITFKFTTTDYVTEEEAERAAKEEERLAKEEEKRKQKEEQDAKAAEEAKIPSFKNSSVWITSESGKNTQYFVSDATYTVHVKIAISGDEQGEGVHISCSNINSLVLDENNQAFYIKLTADNIADSTIGTAIARGGYIDNSDIIHLQVVKNSVEVKTAAGTYSLSDKDFFNYESGCFVGFSGADGLIPTGNDHSVEVTFQIKTSTKDSKTFTSFSGLLQKPIFTIALLIIAIIEFFCIIHMAFRPDNRLARFIIRCRKAAGSIRAGFKTARADLRSDKKKSDDQPTEQAKVEPDETDKKEDEA